MNNKPMKTHFSSRTEQGTRPRAAVRFLFLLIVSVSLHNSVSCLCQAAPKLPPPTPPLPVGSCSCIVGVGNGGGAIQEGCKMIFDIGCNRCADIHVGLCAPPNECGFNSPCGVLWSIAESDHLGLGIIDQGGVSGECRWVEIRPLSDEPGSLRPGTITVVASLVSCTTCEPPVPCSGTVGSVQIELRMPADCNKCSSPPIFAIQGAFGGNSAGCGSGEEGFGEGAGGFGNGEIFVHAGLKGNAAMELGSASAVISLGAADFGLGTGQLQIYELLPSADLATPRCLKYHFTNYNNEIITNSYGIRQIRNDDLFMDCVFTNSYKYYLNFYHTNVITGTTAGLYTFSGVPYATVTLENTNSSGTTTNTLRVTDKDGYVYDYVYSTNGVTNIWELTTGGGLRKDRHCESWSGSNKTVRAETVNGSASLESLTVTTYTNAPFGMRILQTTVGEGSSAQTTSYAYWPSGYVKQVVYPGGSWVYAEYDGRGRATNVLSAYGNQSPTNNSSLCRQVEYDYSTNVISGSGDAGIVDYPRRTIHKLLGQEIGRSYFVALPFEYREIVCVTPGAAWTGADNLVTVRKFVSDTNLFYLKPKSVLHPDGTLTLYQYSTNNYCEITTTVFDGQPGDSYYTNVIDGTKAIRITGNLGQMVSRTTKDIVSGITLGSLIYTNYDDFNRARKVTHLDGTTTTSDLGCCGPLNRTNRDGSVLTHRQDALKRYTSTTYSGATATNIYDAARNLLASVRVGSDGSQITNHVATYDTAGRMLTSKDALGNTTTYTESADGLTRTNTYPDGGTRIESYLLDGSPWKVTGSAVHPMRYTNGVESFDGYYRTWRQEIKLDANGNDTAEWTKTYLNFAGRHYKTLHSDGATSQSFYNLTGHLVKQTDPDGVTTLFAYDALGERAMTAMDMDRNGVIDTNGTDRITLTTSVAANVSSQDFQIAKTYNWATNNSAVSNLVSETRTSTDGLQSWNVAFGLTNHSRTVIGTAGNVYVTNTAPDGSFTVSHTLTGLVQSVTRKDSAGNQLGKTTYTYDAHGRQLKVTDARNGTTTLAYDNADRVLSVTTPPPGTGQPAQTTTYSNDSAGRLVRTTLADGGGVTNIYSLKGELLTNFGARVYPVANVFDAQGRRTNMITWQNFAARTGAASTTWNFDPTNGLLTSKVYADGKGITNTYTPGRRLRTRTWARGITTTYETNTAGQVFATTYSDGTTPNVTNHVDRLGLVTNILDAAGSRFLSYDSAGRLLMETNASGTLYNVALVHAYDWLGRQTNVKSKVAGVEIFSHSYAYDSSSRLTNASDGPYTASYIYLANSPLVSQITCRSNSAVAMTTTKKYDYLNRLLNISSQPSGPEQAVSFGYTYNDANQRTRRSDPDGSYWLYEYDKLGQLVRGKHFWDDNTPVAGQQFEYAYDDIGNRTSTKEGGDSGGDSLRSAAYSANVLNQYTNRTVPGAADIIGIAHPNASVTVNGNNTYRKGEYFWKELSIGNSSAPVWTNVQNIALLTGTNQTNSGYVLHPKATEVFTYDADGNQTSDSLWTNSWDGENRLIVAESAAAAPSGGKVKEAWTFDSEGHWAQRVAYYWNGTTYVAQLTNRFLWDDTDLVAILDHTNGLVMSFLRPFDMIGSFHNSGCAGAVLAVNIATNGLHFIASDGNRNVVCLVSGVTGAQAGNYEYDPYGNPLRKNGEVQNVLGFGTQFFDSLSGQLQYLYRAGRPSIGRWLSRDPIEETGGRNLYAFVVNNPINHVDQHGLLACDCCCANDVRITPDPMGPALLVLDPVFRATRYQHSFTVTMTTIALSFWRSEDCKWTHHEAVTSRPDSTWGTATLQPGMAAVMARGHIPPGGSHTIDDAPGIGTEFFGTPLTAQRTLTITFTLTSGPIDCCETKSVTAVIVQKLKLNSGIPIRSYESFTVDYHIQ